MSNNTLFLQFCVNVFNQRGELASYRESLCIQALVDSVLIQLFFYHVFLYLTACVHAKSFQSCLTLCDPMDRNLPGSSVHGILQARILEWVLQGFFRAQGSNLNILSLQHWQVVPLPLMPPGKPLHLTTKTLQLRPTLCNPMVCSLPGSSIQEILLARILEGVAVSFSRGASQPRDRTRISALTSGFFTTSTTWKALLDSNLGSTSPHLCPLFDCKQFA